MTVQLTKVYEAQRHDKKSNIIGLLSTETILEKFYLNEHARAYLSSSKDTVHLVLVTSKWLSDDARARDRKAIPPAGIRLFGLDDNSVQLRGYIYIVERLKAERLYTLRGHYIYATSLPKAEERFKELKFLWVDRQVSRLDPTAGFGRYTTSPNLKKL